MSEINILYTFDSKFYKLAAVSMASVLINANPDTHVHIYCMVSPFTRGHRFIKKIAKKYNADLTWKTVPKWRNPYKKFDFSRWSPVIFYRLFAHKMFPKLDKILYLDSDTLVCTDLSEMYNTDITEYTLAAVRDMAPIHNPRNRTPGEYVQEFSNKYINRLPYINSGVLLLNLSKMADAQSDLQNIKIALKYPDQDMINYCLCDKIKLLDLKYNFAPGISIPRFFSETQRKDAKTSPAIVHFYTAKPYLYNFIPHDLYAKYTNIANAIGLYAEDLQKHEEKYEYRRSNPKTILPFVRYKAGKISFFRIPM